MHQSFETARHPPHMTFTLYVCEFNEIQWHTGEQEVIGDCPPPPRVSRFQMTGVILDILRRNPKFYMYLDYNIAEIVNTL